MMRFFILMVVVILAACKPQKTVTVVKGKIIGDTPKSIHYTVPVNGECGLQFLEEIAPDSSGNFQFELLLEKPAFIRLLIFEKLYDKFIIAEPGNDYDVTLDFTDNGNIFDIKCESESGHKFYNSLDLPIHIDVIAGELSTDTSFSFINKNIILSREKEFLELEKQHDKGIMSNKFYAIVKKDRQTYYESLIQAVALRKHSYYRRDNEVAKANKILNDYAQLFKDYDINDFPLNSPWSFDLLNQYVEFKRLNLKYSKSNNNSEMTKKQGSSITTYFALAKQHLTGSYLELFTANYLYRAGTRRKSFDYDLIQLAADFKADFPVSDYVSYLDTMVKPIVEFHQKEDQKLNENIVIIDDHLSINSLEECAQFFKGKKIYVDVWATWCQPCLQEFQHSEALKKLLDSKDIAMLYVSIDKEEKDEEWKKRIKYHKLEGYHLRANEDFYAELREIQQGVPLYLILDEHGKILKKHAKKPSQIEEI